MPQDKMFIMSVVSVDVQRGARSFAYVTEGYLPKSTDLVKDIWSRVSLHQENVKVALRKQAATIKLVDFRFDGFTAHCASHGRQHNLGH